MVTGKATKIGAAAVRGPALIIITAVMLQEAEILTPAEVAEAEALPSQAAEPVRPSADKVLQVQLQEAAKSAIQKIAAAILIEGTEEYQC